MNEYDLGASDKQLIKELTEQLIEVTKIFMGLNKIQSVGKIIPLSINAYTCALADMVNRIVILVNGNKEDKHDLKIINELYEHVYLKVSEIINRELEDKQ